MAVAGQQQRAAPGMLGHQAGHELVARQLGQGQPRSGGSVELAAMAGFDDGRLGLLDAVGHVGAPTAGGQALLHHAAGFGARHIRRHDRQAMLQGQADVGAVERPVPAAPVAAGLHHRVDLGVQCRRRAVGAGPAGTVQRWLEFTVELLQQQCRPVTPGQQGGQQFGAQRMLGGVVVHLAQQQGLAGACPQGRHGRGWAGHRLARAGCQRAAAGQGQQPGRRCQRQAQGGALAQGRSSVQSHAGHSALRRWPALTLGPPAAQHRRLVHPPGFAMPPIDLQTAPQLLHTDRLQLAAPCAAHAAAFAEGVAASMAALGFVAWGQRPRDLAWALRFCEDDARSRAAGQDLAFHAFARASGAWVGRIDVHSIDFSAARGEIGYVGNVRLAGQGLMREAVRAVIHLCFDLGFERIEAMSDARNARALHFADSLGLLQREGLLRRHERDLQGQPCDMVLWAALHPHGPLPVGPGPA